MKKVVFAVLMLMATCILYATEDYRGGNGTILREETIGDKEIKVRKFEVSGWYGLDIEDNNIYDDFIKKNKIGSLEQTGPYYDFYEICFIYDVKKENNNETWIKLSDKKITGWVLAFPFAFDTYAGGEYSYLGSIESGSKTYHIRKLSGSGIYFFSDNLEVRDKPGNEGNIIAETATGTSIQEFDFGEYEGHKLITTVHYFDYVAITEEDTDNGWGSWYKIEYEKGKFGWVPWHGVSTELFGPGGLTPGARILRGLAGM